ncbi:arginase family enzyme [Heliobacterium gestii]|nr:arginase family enzyme [Heliomicrobium gestii]
MEINQQEIFATIKNIEKKLDERCGLARTIMIGGDHSVTYPSFKKASGQRSTGLVWFDAHPDVLDTYQNSKYSHGSPLRRIIEDTHIDTDNIMLVGTRFYELDEFNYIKSKQIYEMPAYEINDSIEYATKFSTRVNEIASRVDQLYVSIDIDVIDSGLIVGTGAPVTGGITPHQLFTMINVIPPKAQYFDIMEYSPICDFNDIGARFILVLLSEILSNFK